MKNKKVIKMSDFIKKKEQKEKDRIINELLKSTKSITWLYNGEKNDN